MIRSFFLLINICFVVICFYSCQTNNSETNQQANDADYKMANEIDSLPSTSQKNMDSINRVYLDSLTKHMDTNNAEFGNHH